ncbi:uncharacterized protein N7484_011426 [Penicillium longicatenatum]|uniref:uncharacterized protein n=1 Tax=Penicillium longicatenatum TaxID=1561947 RepID=UPI002547110C|nr:uncharacterized protein N7484_011426 [Penicillium longicatenatum]KAJ5631326.1 hypothetical protein N7484_011426 [Penicillium longicatenatum]
MPIPTAEIYDKEQQQTAENQASSNTLSSENNGSNGQHDVSSSSAAGSVEGERVLSREEADRLYEERMEDEYAKREGGA